MNLYSSKCSDYNWRKSQAVNGYMHSVINYNTTGPVRYRYESEVKSPYSKSLVFSDRGNAMKKLNRKIIKRVCVCVVLFAFALWLVPLPMPFHMSLSGVRVEGAAAAEPAKLEADGWRLYRFLRTTELRASFTVETAQGAKTYKPVDGLAELTFPDGPIRHADGGWYDPASNAIETLRFTYGIDGATAFFEVTDDGQKRRFVFFADGHGPTETMDFLRVEPDGD